MNGQNCGNCAHAFEQKDPNNIGTVVYQCQCMPPAPVALLQPMQGGQMGQAIQTVFPVVTSDAVCGQWQEKRSAAESE